ncbi:MAG: class I SAM-dependent methyltransferase [Acidobacteriota bacterium]|nr:class I SAM-dependent methyltransferase [Acidobacteriota bacterium]
MEPQSTLELDVQPGAPEPGSLQPGPLVRALLAASGLAGEGIDLSIDPHDEMLGFLVESQSGDVDRALFTYFQSGLSIADSLREVLAWRFGDPGRVGKLLDFASGYGRVTRFLLRSVPADRVWVSDIYAEAVAFQEERFAVHGLASTVRPEDLACAETFDAVLVTSLFTHLPEERFIAWLRVLLGRLTPGGVLVWSAHDEGLLPPERQMPAGGILFEEKSESGSLATADYGSTWVSEGFVREALTRAVGSGGFSVHRLPRGLCNFQDLYVTVPEAGADFSGLRFRGEPLFHMERCAIRGTRQLELSGWAAVPGTGRLTQVEVLLDGVLLQSLPIDGPRRDVAAALGGERFLASGWGGSCLLPEGVSRRSAVLLLRVVGDRGDPVVVQAGSIEAALLASARLEVIVLGRELAQSTALLRSTEAHAAHAIAELRARLAAMEASRFWKLRNAWFRVKKLFGLTGET